MLRCLGDLTADSMANIQRRCKENASLPVPENIREMVERDKRFAVEQKIITSRRASVIPVRYVDVKLCELRVDKENYNAIHNARALIASDFKYGVGFWGDKGTGKSTLAAAIANEAIACGFVAKMFNPERMLGRMFDASTYGGEERIKSVREDIAKSQVLIIDDFGSETLTHQKLSWMFEFINERWNQGRNFCTIVTSNLAFLDLAATYNGAAEKAGDRPRGEAIIDRIRAMTWPWYEMRGKSRRQTTLTLTAEEKP